MVTIHVKGRVTDEGELIFDAPKDLPPGEMQITIEAKAVASAEEPINTGTFLRLKNEELLKDTSAIEADIQKAIETCWDTIPQERRNAERLLMEIMRLTSKQIQQFLSQQK